jgi:tRNA threonylcarbamoyl adenosine modification protein (Sua5/YciO/YrdC/YwlC family)
MSTRAELLRALRDGGVALLAVDTVVGLHASSQSSEGLDAIRARKASPADRPFLLLFSSIEDVLRVARPFPSHEAALRQAWPGPLTALLRPVEAAPAAWGGPSGLIAARVPALAPLRELIAELGAPLWSSSANRAGEPATADLDAARAQFPDLVWADFAGQPGDGQASTLVDLSGPEARILRPGAASWPPS